MMTRSDSFSDAKELSRLDDPSVWKHCVKLKRRSDLETALLGISLPLLAVSFFLLIRGFSGTTSRSGRYHPPAPFLIPYGEWALGIAVAALAVFFCCRSFYLLDPTARRLYYQFQILWWRRRRLAFRQEEIAGITTEGQMKSSKYGTYWNYRLTAVGLDGRQEALSNWRREGLEMWNAKARELAGLLGCQSYAAPRESAPSVELQDGKPVLRFDTPPSLWTRSPARFVLFTAVVVVFLTVVLSIIVMPHR
jgi:hypothetical protein